MQKDIRSAIPRTVTRKKTGSASDHQEEDVGRAVAESLPKNLIAAHPVQGSQADEGSGGTRSPAAPCVQRYGMGKAKGQLRCGLSEAKRKNWTDRVLRIYGCDGKGAENPRRRRAEETITGAISSPSPSRRENSRDYVN